MAFCLLVQNQIQHATSILADILKSFVGSSMTTIFVCDDHKAKYNQGKCAKPNEIKKALFSLWFAYAVDVATDLTGTNIVFEHGFDLFAYPYM